jgi:hypothetical protein
MRIAFVSADWGTGPDGFTKTPGGAGWVRIHQPAMALANWGGHQVVIGAGIASDRKGRLVPLNHEGLPLMLDADLVVIQRWMHRDAADAIRAAREYGQVVVQDVDDWFWGLDRANQAHRNTDPRVSPDNNREHYRRAVLASDVVTVSTEFLAKRIRERLGVPTLLIRNAIDVAMFPTQPRSEATSGLTVGWVGALAWRSGDLETLRGVLPRFLRDTGSVFVHHGVSQSDRDTAADRLGLTPDLVGPSRPLVPPLDYPDNLAGFDIGIVPLADVPFNHAKSWIKGLEYAASGIPFVAQAVPEYRAFRAGITAATPDDWEKALHQLTRPEMRRAAAAQGILAAQEQDIRRRWTDWDAAYRALADHRAA